MKGWCSAAMMWVNNQITPNKWAEDFRNSELIVHTALMDTFDFVPFGCCLEGGDGEAREPYLFIFCHATES